MEPSSRHCQTRATTSFFPSHLVTGRFKGYCIWLDSNIVLSPARGWPHMGVLEEGENQEAFPYLIAFLVITYPWQLSALGSPPCSLSTETGPVLCWQQRHQHHRGGQGQRQSLLPPLTWQKAANSYAGKSVYHIFSNNGAPFCGPWIVNQSEFIQELNERARVWTYQVNPGLM